MSRPQWLRDRSLPAITGSNSTGRHSCLSLVSVVCCHVDVSAKGWSLVQRGATECGVSECDGEASIMRSWPGTGLKRHRKKTSWWFKTFRGTPRTGDMPNVRLQFTNTQEHIQTHRQIQTRVFTTKTKEVRRRLTKSGWACRRTSCN